MQNLPEKKEENLNQLELTLFKEKLEKNLDAIINQNYKVIVLNLFQNEAFFEPFSDFHSFEDLKRKLEKIVLNVLEKSEFLLDNWLIKERIKNFILMEFSKKQLSKHFFLSAEPIETDLLEADDFQALKKDYLEQPKTINGNFNLMNFCKSERVLVFLSKLNSVELVQQFAEKLVAQGALVGPYQESMAYFVQSLIYQQSLRISFEKQEEILETMGFDVNQQIFAGLQN